MAKRRVADSSMVWLKQIERMTETDREKIRRRIGIGVILTVDNSGMVAAMRVFDERTRVLRDMPRHKGMKKV